MRLYRLTWWCVGGRGRLGEAVVTDMVVCWRQREAG